MTKKNHFSRTLRIFVRPKRFLFSHILHRQGVRSSVELLLYYTTAHIPEYDRNRKSGRRWGDTR